MNQRTCNATRLSQFLGGDLSSHEELLLTGHLDQCTSCRDRLDELAADPASWTEAKEMLCDVVDQVTCTKPANNSDSLQIEQVLAQLGPTDDPESLGRIGGYEVTGVIGSGGMGVVLKAHDRSLDRVVAVKVMAPHLAASGSARQRFAREAKAAAAVLHPNVIAIHGVSNDQSLPYLVMPYVRGASLQMRIDAEGPLPTIDILRIGSQVAAGLTAAHEQGLVHRDIKPANILLEQGVERVAITDFGLARAVDDASMTRSGVIAGTPQYMSPEQARGEAIDARSDLFSLGSLMYAMCTGHSPFRAETSYGVLHRITHDAPRAIRELNPNIPEWLEKIVMKLLSKSREDRFGSGAQVAELLEDCLAHVQQPTVIALPRTLAEQTFSKSSESRQGFGSWLGGRLGARALVLGGVGSVALIMLCMQFQNDSLPPSAQRTSGPLTGAHANLNELLEQQKSREESIRQISYQGTERIYASQEIQRVNTESVDEFVARCVGLAPVYNEVPPYTLSASRDFGSGVYRFTKGDINAGIPKDIKYMDWFINKGKYIQLMGRELGVCEATVTNNREDIQDDRKASLVRLDTAAFRPVQDLLMSEVLTKAISEPGIPDVGGRPLWKLEPLDNKDGWKATFMFQQPIANPPGARQIHWYRVYWEKIGGELVIVRVDKLTVDGDENSTPHSVLLLDDYRSVCGKPVPFRVRCFVLGDVFFQGAELIVSSLQVNDYVDVPDDLPIPDGSPVRNHITDQKYRQPPNNQSDPIGDAAEIQGTWNVVEMQQVGYEPSEGEREFYKSGGYKITFTKDKMIHSPDHSSMQYRLDTTKVPGVLELTKDGKVIAKGIYELMGDELRICQGRTPTDGSQPKPPASFDIKQAAPDEFPSLMILRRTKPIEPTEIPNLTYRRAGVAGVAATAGDAYQALEKLLSNPKMDRKSTELYITTVATRMTKDIVFAKYVLTEFKTACAGGEPTYQARRHLLAVLTRVFRAWGQSRWSTDPASIQQNLKPSETRPQEIRDFELSALESVVSYGQKATRSDIVDFVRAARALHHPDAKPFLQAVLLNPQTLNSSPYATPAIVATPPKQSTWSDSVGGTWPDARFVAAVGFAELGDPSAIDW
jgi:uncharacterized protein (TIGR03067 family)